VPVALEPAIAVARDHVRGVRDVAGHQRVDGRKRGLDRLALERVAAPEVDRRVLASRFIHSMRMFKRHIANARYGPIYGIHGSQANGRNQSEPVKPKFDLHHD
jgi:hypothetical protein